MQNRYSIVYPTHLDDGESGSSSAFVEPSTPSAIHIGNYLYLHAACMFNNLDEFEGAHLTRFSASLVRNETRPDFHSVNAARAQVTQKRMHSVCNYGLRFRMRNF